MLAAAPAAYAQEPTITTDITFPEEGEPFGTFTATRAAVSIGDIRGRVRRWRRSIMSDKFFYSAFTIRKHFTCDDGSGTFMILFHPQFNPRTSASCDQAGPFAVVGRGTGDYTRLNGHGDFCVFTVGARITETFTGTFRL
jgi:hypothetical protein